MKDMMLGLENWIPLYMTGQISPYYLKGIQNKVYCHLHYTSGQAAMTGDCISGHHDTAHYYLTSRREEVEICRKNTEYLLKKAHLLMEIYREEKKRRSFRFPGKGQSRGGQAQKDSGSTAAVCNARGAFERASWEESDGESQVLQNS